MLWFGKPPETPPPTLVQRVDSIESDLKAIRLEWEEVYDKVHAAIARLNKRERDAAKGAGTPNGESQPTAAPVHPKAHLYELQRSRNALSR